MSFSYRELSKYAHDISLSNFCQVLPPRPDGSDGRKASLAMTPRGAAIRPSVAKVAAVCGHHRDARAVGGGDHIRVPNRATRLDDRRDARRDRQLGAVGEREVRV